MRRFALLIVLVAVGCSRAAPAPAPPSTVAPAAPLIVAPAPPSIVAPSTSFPIMRGQVEQNRLLATANKPDGFGAAMVAFSTAQGDKAEADGWDKTDEWMYVQLHGKTPEQFVAEWGSGN